VKAFSKIGRRTKASAGQSELLFSARHLGIDLLNQRHNRTDLTGALRTYPSFQGYVRRYAMAKRSRETVVPRTEPALDRFKYEVADELGLLEKIKSQGWGEMTTREAGSVGGQMVRKLIEAADESLSER
jgi:hypothetical protein